MLHTSCALSKWLSVRDIETRMSPCAKRLVFGSNLAGIHGKGAALFARQHHGAELGVGQGPTGNAYAIPTKDRSIRTLPVFAIRAYVAAFLEYARSRPDLRFQVTRIGCGLAGYSDAEIAPLFHGSPGNCVLPEGWRQAARLPERRSYAGIGSRKTPAHVAQNMREIAFRLASLGWVLRSGRAEGADEAFEVGARQAGGQVEVFLPWHRFREADPACSVDASALPEHAQACELAKAHHPAWARLEPSARKLMARNAHQVLGAALDAPVQMVVCWAPGSVMDTDRVVNVDGGTGLAVRLAAARGIPVFNLAVPEHAERIANWLDRPSP